ncbi:MAG: ACP S-malonyltransferase [Anaerolineales bacterium]|nr:ACP S-malonyltransferase [Anaerolineales bacterium]MCX7755659.1 ACP S-malonyltransferase [Anaerolineales bacterium]MDW8278963.1 ACP S-malonyltransferase [Anaerolineales bacterium]
MTIDFSKTAFVFPGQGSQAVGMGRALAEAFPAARAVFEEADVILGFPFSQLMWDGPKEELDDTLNTQPALFIHSLAAWRAINPPPVPIFVAGHSLGQLSALTAAGALSFAEGLRLVRKRGELMKLAGERNPGGMAAILGLDIPTLEQVCAAASTPAEVVQVANDNCPGQVVISGHKAALERAIAGAKAAGAKRALPLAVSIAAHSPLMASIQSEWDAAVNEAPFSDARIPVVGNVSAGPLVSAEALRADVRAQMQNRVRWTESVHWMRAQGVETFVEAGTGVVLGGLVKRILEGVTTLPLGNPEDFAAL